MTAPLVFLDIDGVLNTPEDYAKWSAASQSSRGCDPAELLFNPALVERLNRITDAASAAIVVSSSWRMFYTHGDPGGKSFADLRGLFRRVGIKAKVLGPTPVNIPERWSAIGAWIADWQRWNPAQAPRVAVLDDDVPSAQWQWKPNHVHCRAFPGGLTQENEDHAVRLLTGTAP